jgi:glycosyltransferase involved in cell wall biosynthesis
LFELRYGNPAVTRLLRVFQRLAFREADLVLTTNESQRELVIDTVGRDPDTVIVVRNGPRSGVLPGLSVSVEQPPPSARVPIQLVFVGALEPQDGTVALAQVLSVLVDRHRLDARLTVVGSGSCRAPLEAECERLGVRQRIAFTGRVPHEAVADLLARADVCVDPAPCNELNHRSTMIKIAEYMAARKPIVAFDLRETRRTAGGAALYAACGDVDGFAERIVEIAGSEEVRRELSRAAETRLPELMWEHSAEALTGAYRTLSGL